MATKKQSGYKGMGSKNPQNKAAMAAAGMGSTKAKKTTTKKKTTGSAIDKATRSRIDKIRERKRKEMGLKKK